MSSKKGHLFIPLVLNVNSHLGGNLNQSGTTALGQTVFHEDGTCTVWHDSGSSTNGTTVGSGGDRKCVKDGRALQA